MRMFSPLRSHEPSQQTMARDPLVSGGDREMSISMMGIEDAYGAYTVTWPD